MKNINDTGESESLFSLRVDSIGAEETEIMGKKARTASGIQKAQSRKVDKSTLPPAPLPPTEEVRNVLQPSLVPLSNTHVVYITLSRRMYGGTD